jgi:hypothetical protein
MYHPALITTLIAERERQIRSRVDGPRAPSRVRIKRR